MDVAPATTDSIHMDFRLLVVEDNPGDAQLISEYLADDRFDLVFAQRLGDAVSTLDERDFDLVLLDLGLPDSHGLASAVSLLESHPDVPVVVLSGLEDGDTSLQAVHEGVQDFVPKARLTSDGLTRSIRYAIERHRMRRQLDAFLAGLRAQQANLENVIRGAAVGLVVLDAEGIVRFANQAAESLLSEVYPELVGARLPYGDEDSARRQIELGTPGGRTLTIETRVTPMAWEGSRATLLSLRDLTEQRESERALLESEAKLQQSQKMEAIGNLAAGIAHDFNNMLAVILGFTELAELKLPPASPAASALVEVKHASARAANLTQQLLAFGRRESLRPRNLDLNDVIRNFSKLLTRIVGEDVELVTKLGPSAGPILADRGQIEQVLLNLCVNARDAMPRGGRLGIETSSATMPADAGSSSPELPAGSYVRLAVTDTGRGIPSEIRERIFEPFFTTKGPKSGTGLGLATVQSIVDQADGSIHVESTPGEGSRFDIYFPRRDGLADDVRTSTFVEAAGGSETILLVEDEESVRELARQVLESRGYRVVEATNGAEAVRIAASLEPGPDLVLTDVVMPEMGGPEAARKIRRAHPDVKVLYLSGYWDRAKEDVEELTPGHDLVEKPFSTETLARAVRERLDRSAADRDERNR